MTAHQNEQDQQERRNQFLTEENSYEEVMQWLSSHLPRLKKDDAVRYCECLMDDGFDSFDVLAEITEEDVHFMKKAHQRTLIKRMREES